MSSVTQTTPEQPLVSVITPTYNRPEYLREAIASAISQTYQNIEIIVSDNCSQTNPLPIIEAFNDPRIKFSRNDTNVGMLANVVNSFKRAQGKYIACLLDDDKWTEHFLEEMIPPLEQNSMVSVAFCDHYVMDEHSQVDPEKTEECSQTYGRIHLKEGLYAPFYELFLISRSVSPAIAAVMRRDAIDWGSIPSDVGSLWDTYVAYLHSTRGYGAYYVPKRLTLYREHSQTVTMQSGRQSAEAKLAKAKSSVFCYETFSADDHLSELRPFLKRKLAHDMTTVGIALMRMQHLQSARPHFWRALKTHFSLRTLAACFVSYLPAKIACQF
ncbi:MAG: glycosyltransferase family 2 protein [Cyanobacteria bacterium J06638_22]